MSNISAGGKNSGICSNKQIDATLSFAFVFKRPHKDNAYDVGRENRTQQDKKSCTVALVYCMGAMGGKTIRRGSLYLSPSLDVEIGKITKKQGRDRAALFFPLISEPSVDWVPGSFRRRKKNGMNSVRRRAMQAEALARDGRALSVDGLQRNEKKG